MTIIEIFGLTLYAMITVVSLVVNGAELAVIIKEENEKNNKENNNE